MRPVFQTRFGAPTGQCTEASIASILECELHEVPDLYDPERPDSRERTWPILLQWLVDRGVCWVGGPLGAHRMLPLVLPEELPHEQHNEGLQFARRELTVAWRRWHLLLGTNSAGVGHACVGWGGRLIHDPNPSRAGLVTVDEVAALVPTVTLCEKWPTAGPVIVQQGGFIWTLQASPPTPTS